MSDKPSKEAIELITAFQSYVQAIIDRTHALNSEAHIPRVLTMLTKPWNARATCAALGVCKEAGEIGSLVDKLIFQLKPYEVDEFRDRLIDESGDLLYYLFDLFNIYEIKFTDVITHLNSKLLKRFPTGFSIREHINTEADNNG